MWKAMAGDGAYRRSLLVKEVPHRARNSKPHPLPHPPGRCVRAGAARGGALCHHVFPFCGMRPARLGFRFRFHPLGPFFRHFWGFPVRQHYFGSGRPRAPLAAARSL